MKKTIIIFLDCKFLKLFLGVTQGDKIYFFQLVLGTGCVTFLYTTHSRRKMEVLVTPTKKLDKGRGTSLIPSMAVEKICIQIRYTI